MTKIERIMFEKSSDYAWDYLKEDDVGLAKSSFEAGFRAALELPQLKLLVESVKNSFVKSNNLKYAIADYESLFKEGE